MSVGEMSSSKNGKDTDLICGLDWIKSEDAPKVEAEWPEVSIVDLFCGCGGMSLGVREALRRCNLRADIALAVDLMEEAVEFYRRALGCGARAKCMDVRDVFNDADLIEELAGTDVLLAGPPCQGHSDLNNHTRREDERNSLYETAAQFAIDVDPEVVIIENVPGARHDTGEVVQKAEELLRKKGHYCTHTVVLEAVDYGIPQTRKRLFLIGSKVPIELDDLKAYGGPRAERLKPFIVDLEGEHDRSRPEKFRHASRMSVTNQWRAAWLTAKKEKWLRDDMRPDCHRGKDHSYMSVYGRLCYEEPAQTITTGFGSMGQGRFLHPNPALDDLRVITPHEAARIQGLPDFLAETFDEVKTRRALHGMIGNAVPPKIVAVLMQNLLDAGALPNRTQSREASGRTPDELIAAE